MYPNPPSQAEEFFRNLRSRGDQEQFLRSLVNIEFPTFEESWLDFKAGFSFNADEIKRDGLKHIWSKCLGAMANTEGGVIIWGIQADRSNVRKIDAAHSISLCPDVDALKGRLKELTPSATARPVLNVEFLNVITEGTKGFLVCHIPRSRSRPHRSEHAGKRFYCRVQDHSDDVPYEMLKRLFTPERSVELRLQLDFRRHESVGEERYRLCFMFTNTGNATADDFFCVIESIPQMRSEINQQNWSARSISTPGQGFKTLKPIHPRESYPPLVLSIPIADEDVDIRIVCFCRDQEPAVGTLILDSILRKTHDHEIRLERMP